jgi:hypothetical protein
VKCIRISLWVRVDGHARQQRRASTSPKEHQKDNPGTHHPGSRSCASGSHASGAPSPKPKPPAHSSGDNHDGDGDWDCESDRTDEGVD